MRWTSVRPDTCMAKFMLAVAAVLTGSSASSGPAAIHVGGNSRYATIQQGISAAEIAGLHHVIVAPGTYTKTDALGPADDGLTISAAMGSCDGHGFRHHLGCVLHHLVGLGVSGGRQQHRGVAAEQHANHHPE